MHKISKVAALAALSTVVVAGPAAALEPVGPANENARSCVLSNGVEYSSVGQMMQHLRDRDGNPAATVDIYSKHFDSVGDLVEIKCS